MIWYPIKSVFRLLKLLPGSAECQVDCGSITSHSETFPSLSPLIVSKRSILYRHIPASVIFRSLQGLEKQAAEILLPEGCSHRLRFSADRCGTDDLLLARSGEVRCLDSVKLCACTGNSCERLAKCPQRIKRVSLRLEWKATFKSTEICSLMRLNFNFFLAKRTWTPWNFRQNIST